jgi:hypothetical protein
MNNLIHACKTTYRVYGDGDSANALREIAKSLNVSNLKELENLVSVASRYVAECYESRHWEVVVEFDHPRQMLGMSARNPEKSQ